MARGRRNGYVPSEREIRNACEEIQQQWTEKERRRRRYGNLQSVPRYTIPEYDLASLMIRPRGPLRSLAD